MARGKAADSSAWLVREEPTSAARLTFGGWKRRGVRVLLWVILVSSPITGLALAAVVANRGPATAAGASSSVAAGVSSPGRTAATLSLLAWLETAGAPRGAEILSWDGAASVPAVVNVNANGQPLTPPVGFTSEVNRFTVVDSAGRAFRASVQVMVDPRGGAEVLGGPFLEPVATVATDGWTDGGPWAGLVASTSATDSVKTAVQGWATAYTSGDSGVLRLALGDTSSEHAYLALAGVSGVSTDVLSVAQLTPTDKGRVVARVSMLVQWAGRALQVDDPKVDKDKAAMVVDLLIERADTAAPLVTAWGAPGSGPTLTRYGNAVVSVSREAVVLPTPQTSAGL